MEESKFKMPTETVELPSKGLLYPEDSELAKGVVEIKYMTAKEEDILTNQSYIRNGTVLDKLIKSLIVSKINYDDLLIGDKNAIMVAARILGYGSEYTFNYLGETHTVDLSQVENKPLKEGTKIKHNEKMQMECFLKFLKKFLLLLKTNGAQKRLIDSFRKV
jgi:hypothetical protein